MKKSSLIKIIAMILVMCMFLTSCSAIEGVLYGVLEKVLGKDQEQIVEKEDPDICHHAKTTLKNAKAATCEAEGYTGDKVCTSCGAVVEKGSSIPTSAHTTVVKNAKPATCSQEGYTGDQVCTECGTIVEKGEAIPTTAHNYDEGMTTKNPTCMSEGTYTYTCLQCGDTYSEPLPVVGHDDRYHDMLDGTHNHTCTTCTLTENEEHVPTDEGRFVPASCEEKAYTEYTCSVCNGVYKVYDETTEPTGHDYGEWQVNEATCVSEGSRFHQCATCGKSEHITIDIDPNAHRHEFAGYKGEAPTCDTGAIAVYICKVCGNDSYEKDVPATGLHNYMDLENTGDGWVRKECTTCHKVVSTFDASTLKEAEVKAKDIPEDVPFEVTTEKAAIEFPTNVIDQLKGGEDVKIGADILTDEAKENAINNAINLAPEAKERLENVELYDFNVTVDGNPLADGFNTAVTVTIPYQLKTFVGEDGKEYTEDAEGIVIWYVAEDGTITQITDVKYNEETGTVTFLAPHFSMYAVAYEETQEMKCRRGYHAYEVIHTVPASCSGYGFSTLQCTTCHRVTVDNITEKLLHTYGETIPANPTCSSGDYDHKVCTVCGDVLNIRYYRELGHQLDKVATCTEGSHCSRCNKTVVMPLGHSWSEWRVVVAAGPTTNGLRVRYCLRCGEAERSETASTGDLSSFKFNSYEELLEAIYDLVVGVDKASVEFTFEAEGYGLIGATALVDKSGDDMLVLVEFTIDGEEAGMAYYKNGVALVKYAGEYGTASIDSLFAVPIDVTASYMQAYYNLLNPYVEMGITSIREQLATYTDIAGEEINNLLAAAGITYTAEDLLALLDSIETVYAYVSLKLGYTTAAEMKDGVRIPTKADFVNVITALMESTTDGENTTYTTDKDALLAQFTELYDKLMAICTKTFENVLFELFGDKIAQLDPTVTDATALAGYLKTQLPGTLMVSEAVDVIEDVMLELGDMTLDELYALINEIMSATYGEEFDVEAMIAEYYSLTLNDLFSGMIGEDVTAEDFYDQLAMMMQQMMIGDIYMGAGSIGDYLAYLNYRLNSIPMDADLSFTVDADGKLLSLTLDESATTVGEFGEEIVIHAITVTITRDDTIVVTRPEELEPVDVVVEGSLDEDGNYVITGVPADAELGMYLEGGYYADLDEILTKDADLSAKFGFDIYTVPQSLWTRMETVASLVKIDGKYYTYSVTPVRGEYPNLDKYVCQMDLFEFLSDPASILPDEDDDPIDYYEDMPFYASPIGYLMQIDGEWWVCDAYLNYTYDKNSTGIINEKYYIGDLSPMYRFNEMFVDSPIDLSSVEDYYYDQYYWYDHVNFNVRIDIYLRGETYEFKGTADADGVRLVYAPRGHIEEKYDEIYNIGSEYQLTDYTYDGMNTYNSHVVIVQINGVQTEKEIETVHLYRYAPTYYFKVASGSYLLLDAMYNTTVDVNGIFGINTGKPTSGYIYTNVNTANLETKELSDGNVMYVVGYAPAYVCGYADGEVTYGYVKISDKGYIRAYCLEQSGYMVDVVYEGCRSETYISFGDLYNVMDYVTTDNGVITVSSELISKLLESCTESGEYFGIQLNATKKIGDDTYHYMLRDMIKFNADFNISLPGGPGTAQVDPFYALFAGHNQGDKYEIQTYVDENGDLVITGADILSVRTEFGDQFPADPFLKYDREESASTGLDIYSYTYYDTYGNTYLYKDGKYYHYDWWHNFAVQTKTLDQIMDSWHVQDMRYCYTISPDENTPEELHGKWVYSILIGCVNDSNKHYGELFHHGTDIIEIYGFIMDGKLQILTGAERRGESLVIFEGYKPFDEYMASLEATVEYVHPYGERAIEGKIVETNISGITIREPGYNVSYHIELLIIEDKYVYGAEIIDEYVFIYDEADVEGNWVERRSYQETFCNGIYELVDFTWVDTHKYRAVKIGDIFYDYDDYYNNRYDQISDLDEFRQQMYNTDRVYRVWDDKIGGYRYYDKFIPGKYFQGDEELFGFVIPTEEYQVTELGVTESGHALEEIVYYIDETIDPEILEITLADGRKFYHIDGIGYVKLKDGHYVRAMLAYDNEGNPYAMCLYRRAYIWDHVLNRTSGDGQLSMFEEYINRTSDSVTIPKEMLDYMRQMHEGAHFRISTNRGEIHINYYILEAYFRGEIGGGYGDDYNDKYEGDDYKDENYGDEKYDDEKYDDGKYDENGYGKEEGKGK